MGSPHAAPMIFDSVSDTGSILYSTTHDGATLSATMTFTLNALDAKSATFGLNVANNSSGPGTNRLTSFGIDIVSPNLKTVSISDEWHAGFNTTLPSFGKVDLCLWVGNNCSGGGKKDLMQEGVFDDFSLTLTTSGNFLTEGISFGGLYGVKFQDVGNGGQGHEFAGCIVGTPNCGPTQIPALVSITQVPEPATIMLMGLALLGASLVRRHKA